MVKILQETQKADNPEKELKIDIIKKGAQYRSIYTERFTFGDCLNYSSPCKYSNYLKQWKVTEEKSIFPYQYFSSIEELEAATDFPPKEAFYSDLTEVGVTDEEYLNAKNEYNSRRALPGKDIYMHIYIYIYISIYTCIYNCIYKCIYTRIYTCIYTRIYTCIYIYIPVYIHVYIPVYIYMYIYPNIYVHIRVYIHTDKLFRG